MLRDVAVARFTRTLGTLTAAGLPILDGLRITRDTLGNAALTKAIDAVQDQVSSGKPIADKEISVRISMLNGEDGDFIEYVSTVDGSISVFIDNNLTVDI